VMSIIVKQIQLRIQGLIVVKLQLLKVTQAKQPRIQEQIVMMLLQKILVKPQMRLLQKIQVKKRLKNLQKIPVKLNHPRMMEKPKVMVVKEEGCMATTTTMVPTLKKEST